MATENERRARRKANPIPSHVRRAIEDQYIACFYCGDLPSPYPFSRRIQRMHLDHVTSLHHGGTSDPSNLVMACARCNLSKQEKHVAAFIWELRAHWTRYRLWGRAS